MPFGLRKAGQTFQALMDTVVLGLNGVFVYLDDTLVASSNPDNHSRHLHALFSCLQENGLNVKPERCLYSQTRLNFLGHHVDSSSIKPLASGVTAIKEFPCPTYVCQLRRILGLVIFCHCCLPQAATVLYPLHILCRAHSLSKPISWDPSQPLPSPQPRNSSPLQPSCATQFSTPLFALSAMPLKLAMELPCSNADLVWNLVFLLTALFSLHVPI